MDRRRAWGDLGQRAEGLLALPDVEARSFLNVEVSDGKGGFAVQQFSVGTSDTGDRFLGTVADASGKPLPKAAVTVDGQAVTVDAAGHYHVAVPVGERHVLTVKHPGHAPVAQVFYGAAMGLKHRLQPATRIRVDPTQPIRVSEQGIELTIEPNQLVDANGHRSTGLLNLDLYRYDASKGELPGDPAGVTADRKATTFVATEAVSIELTDDQGVEYELVPGSTAQLTLPAPSTEARSLQPQAMVFARYDEGKGMWATRGEVTRALQHSFTSQVGHLSIWSVGQLAGETACFHVKVDPFQLDLPFNLRVTVLADGAGGSQEVRNQTITGSDTLIPLLPPRRTVALDVTPLTAPERSIQRSLFVTANTTSIPFPPFPFNGCGFVKLGAKLPATEWLNRIPGSEVTANAYYDSIGARPAKDTFAKWRSLNGFTAADDQNAVVLYNPNELGLGRRLNCSEPSSALRRACYVTKYGEVGGSPVTAFDDTIHNLNPGDTVAMESERADFPQPPVVKYYIYGPDGKLRTNTHFDSGGLKFVPGACQHCHGRPDGKFVVLDPHAYQYPGVSKDSPFGLDQQQEKFRRLNEIMSITHFPQADNYITFLDSLYPNPEHGWAFPGAKAVRAPTPPAWQGQAFLYENVIKPSCRTCHMWQSTFNFEAPIKAHLDLGLSDVCNGKMPNAMSPMLRLWKTTNPSLIHAFADSQGANQCGNILFKGTPPNLTIVAPSGSASYGGIGGVTHTATVSDAEDGQNCCKSVVWSSDVDGKLGVGTTIEFAYPSPGVRTISATATDRDGRMTSRSFALEVKNDPPGVTISAPAASANVFKNTPVVFQSTSFDLNSPFDVPCACRKWTSSNAKDTAFPFTGCEKAVSFKTAGLRTITLTGTDAFGATGTATRQITVQAVPTGSPPVLTIVEPHEGDLIDPAPAITLKSAVNAGAGAVTYRWTVNVSGTEVDIGTGPTLSWLPQSNVPFRCGGNSAVLKLYGTNANGTGTATINIKVLYPVC